MATLAAGPAFRLLGARDLGVQENYPTAQMPPVNHGLPEGELAWRQHDGGARTPVEHEAFHRLGQQTTGARCTRHLRPQVNGRVTP